MHLQLADRLELGKPRRTKEGYLAVRARAEADQSRCCQCPRGAESDGK